MRVILTSQRVKAGQSRTPEDHAVAALGCCTSACPATARAWTRTGGRADYEVVCGLPLVGPALSRWQAVRS
jgi:hypothetical protein